MTARVCKTEPALFTLPIEWDGTEVRDLVLSHTLWSRLFIGTRLVLETDLGDVLSTVVEVGPNDAPVLRWPMAPDRYSRNVTVRFPR